MKNIELKINGKLWVSSFFDEIHIHPYLFVILSNGGSVFFVCGEEWLYSNGVGGSNFHDFFRPLGVDLNFSVFGNTLNNLGFKLYNYVSLNGKVFSCEDCDHKFVGWINFNNTHIGFRIVCGNVIHCFVFISLIKYLETYLLSLKYVANRVVESKFANI